MIDTVMILHKLLNLRIGAVMLFLCLVSLTVGRQQALAQTSSTAVLDSSALFAQLAERSHIELLSEDSEKVLDHEVGLGALQKVSGDWHFKFSQRYSGELSKYTWQVKDGFSSREVMTEVERTLVASGRATLLFACEARGCGPGAQWANRVFGERILYGRDDDQRYKVYQMQAASDGSDYLILLYSSARMADRQYFHSEILALDEAADQ